MNRSLCKSLSYDPVNDFTPVSLTSWGTPPEVVARLNKEIAAALKQPDVAKSFESQGMVPASSTLAEFGALIKKDADR